MTTPKLPSHLIVAQAARFVEVTRGAVMDRVRRERLTLVEHFGVEMVPTKELERWKAERDRRRTPRRTVHGEYRCPTCEQRFRTHADVLAHNPCTGGTDGTP
jgi:hypothetical protein